MNTIKNNEVKKEIKVLEKKLKDFTMMNKNAKQLLEDLGYTQEMLGTGESAYITSKNIKEMNIKSKQYLNGKYLVVGISSIKNGKGCIYRGFVKKIV